MEIKYVIGDATNPIGDGKKIIVHICNDLGGWGKGFVLAISKRWSAPEQAYRSLRNTLAAYCLGKVQLVDVTDDIVVANMIAQRGSITHRSVNDIKNNIPPIRYGAVRACLAQVNDYAYKNNCTIHMPRIGCGLAGGNWSEIENIIEDVLSVDVYVYDLDWNFGIDNFKLKTKN